MFSEILSAILLTMTYCLAPAGVLLLCKKVKWLGKIGPVLILYILGMLIPLFFPKSEAMASVQDILSSAMVPIAIPLMLFGCTFRKSETRSQLLALVTGLAAVVAAVTAGYFIFGKNIDGGEKIGAMLTGVYTGGTINLAALKTMLGVPEETFILLNSYDMVISFLYLVFLVAIGIKLFRKFLPTETSVAREEISENQEDTTKQYRRLLNPEGRKEALILICVTAVIVGISAGIAIILPQGWFMTVFILLLTTLGIAASFNKSLRGMKMAEPLGMYCIYIFSIVVASMADFRNIDLSGGLNILGYLTFVIFFSLILQVILAKIFRIDTDTMVIASTSLICSPPFVPMMAAAMGNKKVIIAGLSIGIIGYAAGNYLGFLIYSIFSAF